MARKVTKSAVPLSIQYVATATLIPDARNARTHSPEQVEQIAASIRAFGFTNPVLVGADHGIIAGHGRVLAAQLINLSTIPVIELPHLTPAQRRAYLIADNKIALSSGWDLTLLGAELSALQAEGFDLSLTGFNLTELDGLLGEGDDAEAEWRGMPEFDQPANGAFQSVIVHFKDQAAVDAFATLIAQKITKDTRFTWYPLIEIETYVDKRYASDEP